MDDELIFFVIVLAAITSVTIISVLKIILNHAKVKAQMKNQGSSVGLGELEETILSAVEKANIPLANRLHEIEHMLDQNLHLSAPLNLDDQLNVPTPEKTVGRPTRQRS